MLAAEAAFALVISDFFFMGSLPKLSTLIHSLVEIGGKVQDCCFRAAVLQGA